MYRPLIYTYIVLAIIDSSARGSTCDFNLVQNQTKICAHSRNTHTEHQISCILPEQALQVKMHCKIDMDGQHSGSCGPSGCINAHLRVVPAWSENDTLLDLYDHVAFHLVITETTTSHVIIAQSLDGILKSLNDLLEPIDARPGVRRLNAISQKTINRNVSLDFDNSSHQQRSKNAVLQVINIGEEFFYDICIQLYSTNATDMDLDADGANQLQRVCCHLRKYKIKVEKINEVYLAILIIAVAIIFQIIIALVTWQCPRSRYSNIDDLLKSLPTKNVEILKKLVLNRQNLIQATKLKYSVLPSQSNGVQNGSFEPDRQIDQQQHKSRGKIQIITVDDENRPLDQTGLVTQACFHVQHVDNDNVYLSAQDLNKIDKSFATRRHSLFNGKADVLLKTIPVASDGKFGTKIDARKKSVFFHPDLFPDAVGGLDNDDEQVRRQELTKRRKSALLTVDFFLSSNGTFLKAPVSSARRKSLNLNALDDYDVTRAKILQEAKRKQSISQYQRAFTLNPDSSDSDD
jgi:hypothetical protein